MKSWLVVIGGMVYLTVIVALIILVYEFLTND